MKKEYQHTDQEYEFIKVYIETLSGILIPEEKRYLIDHKLAPLLSHFSLENYAALISKANAGSNPKNIFANAIIDAITIHESQWFRDRTPFNLFREIILPELGDKLRSNSRKHIRILSAGSAKGQEAFSLMMLIDRFCNQSSGISSNLFEILAIDISQDVLSNAKIGQFNKFEMERGMPNDILNDFFDQEEHNWRLKKGFLNRVEFKNWNLMDSLESLGMFDVIFLRNVLIYFADWAKHRVLKNISDILKNDGKLLIGSMETLTQNNDIPLKRNKTLDTVYFEKTRN